MADGDDPAGHGTIGRLARLIAAVGAVAAVTILFFWVVPAKPTTVASTHLVAILVISTRRTVVEATSIAVLAGLCFNVFFLSPVGTIAIADPQDWVSFFAFTATGIVTSHRGDASRWRTAPIRSVQEAARDTALRRLRLNQHARCRRDGLLSVRALLRLRVRLEPSEARSRIRLDAVVPGTSSASNARGGGNGHHSPVYGALSHGLAPDPAT